MFGETKGRPTWDQYFTQLCELISTRATCPRKNVGAVLVRDNHVLSVGYNGSLPGLPHCIDVGCDMEDNHCVAVNHAESNAICSAAKYGISLNNSILYTNIFPCWNCFKLVVSSGIKEIVYKEIYGDPKRVMDAWKKIPGLLIRQVTE